MLLDAGGVVRLVVERKTLSDFAASNVDGRYRDQRARLAAFPDAAILYVLEGKACETPLLRRLITRLMLRYGFPVLQTSCVQDSATWVAAMLEQVSADCEVFARTAPDLSECQLAVSAVRRKNVTPLGVAVRMLEAVPRLGKRRAEALLERFSVSDLAHMSRDELSSTSLNGRRLGDKAADALATALTQKSSTI